MAEGNIEVTVAWAPADGVRMLLERAASMLTGYGELIRRDGASHVEEHHYLPEVEHVAAELRALMDGSQMADETQPMDCLTAGDAREAATAIVVLRNDLDIALGMLADWCVAVDVNGTGWDDWDEHYKDAMYRDGPLRAMLDKAIAEARERRA